MRDMERQMDSHVQAIDRMRSRYARDISYDDTDSSPPTTTDKNDSYSNSYFTSNIVIKNDILTWSVSSDDAAKLAAITRQLEAIGLKVQSAPTHLSFSGDATLSGAINQALQ